MKNILASALLPSPFSLLPLPLRDRVGQGREKGREKNPFDFEGAGLNYRFLLLYKKYILIRFLFIVLGTIYILWWDIFIIFWNTVEYLLVKTFKVMKRISILEYFVFIHTFIFSYMLFVDAYYLFLDEPYFTLFTPTPNFIYLLEKITSLLFIIQKFIEKLISKGRDVKLISTKISKGSRYRIFFFNNSGNLNHPPPALAPLKARILKAPSGDKNQKARIFLPGPG